MKKNNGKNININVATIPLYLYTGLFLIKNQQLTKKIKDANNAINEIIRALKIYDSVYFQTIPRYNVLTPVTKTYNDTLPKPIKIEYRNN
jgi:hypothetical protein